MGYCHLNIHKCGKESFFTKIFIQVKIRAAAAAAKSLRLCLTLCDPMDGSPPGSPFPGVLQARTLDWVAIAFSNAWKWEVKVKLLSHVQLLATPWTAACQAPPSMGFFQASVLEWGAIAFSRKLEHHLLKQQNYYQNTAVLSKV